MTGIFVAWNLIIRMLSKGRLEGKRDSAEIDVIKTLQEERNLLREENRLLRENLTLAYKERDEALSRISVMESQIERLKRDLDDSEVRMEVLKARIDDLDRRKT